MPLEIKGLSRRFGDKWVLRDVEMSAREGRVLGLLGASASGKSVLLRLIAGLRPNGGSIAFNGRDLTGVRPKDRDVTLLSAERAGPGAVLGLFGIAVRVSSSEEQLERFEESIANAGKVILVDDAFCRLDAALRDECFFKLRRAAVSRERIVIFATSDFQQIAAVADDVAVLSGGSIARTGTSIEVYEDPQTVETCRLTGEANLITARRLTSSDDELPEFHTIEGGHRLFAHRADKKQLAPINHTMTLAIRPEQVSMSMGASFPEDNLLRSVVTGIRFCGATSLIEFDAAGLKLMTRVFRVVGLNVGDECMLGLPPHRMLILRD